jgi:hypothetical protein
MIRGIYLRTFVAVLAVLCCGSMASAASAADPYKFDPVLSLTGDCSVSPLDPVQDPSCPGPPMPSGRFDYPRSIAIDSYGNEYVAVYGDKGVGRIDVFDDEGRFITELAEPKGPKSLAVDSQGNLYVLRYVLGQKLEVVRYSPTVYEPVAGKIEYGSAPVKIAEDVVGINGGLAIDASNDHLFAAYAGSVIREYGSAAEGNQLLNTISHEKLVGWATWVAVDAERRRLYTSNCRKEIADCVVLVFEADAPHALLEEVDGSDTPEGRFLSEKGWLSIAVDEETGHFFVDDLERTKKVYEFDENYAYVSTVLFSSFQGGNALQIAVSNSPLNPAAKNDGYLFVPVLLPAGRALAFAPPTEFPPDVTGAAATQVVERQAVVRVTIDPKGVDTGYAIEYVTKEEFDESGFTNAQVGVEGTISGGSQPKQLSALLNGLSPGTSYRARIVATNSEGSDEEQVTFATYPAAPLPSSCPNDAVRIGPSVLLPDCRAYELVTPADTNGRPPKGVGFGTEQFNTLQASPLGNAVSFNTEGGSLPGMEGTGGYSGDMYRTVRTASGWTTLKAGPSGTETNVPVPGSPSPDQGYAFWVAGGEGSAIVVEGQQARYVRYPDGHSELIGRGSLGSTHLARGKLITENGTHIIFQTDSANGAPAKQLEPNAPPEGTEAVYDRTADEVTHVVSLLPGDVTPQPGEDATYVGASADGAGIAFTVGPNFLETTLYLRVDNAVTYEIGDAQEVTFAGISEGGERIFYVKGGDLFAFDTKRKEVIAFTSVGNVKVVNVAPDGTRAYFVTTSVIPGGGQNPNGVFAKAGQQNLYLSEEGDVTFVATVTARDVEGEKDPNNGSQVDGLGLWTDALAGAQLARDPSRVSADGSVLLFQSRANLDGYDPKGSPQVYRYDAVADRLHCISCTPTGISTGGGASLESYAALQTTRLPFSASGFVPNLRFDGRRAFFQSKEALVATDNDKVQDVYEWEEQGVGTCTSAGGCVYLISSGHSENDDYLYGISRSGDDVFFVTEDVLVAGDIDTPSIYDARVGGGFPQPSEQACLGEACRPALTPPPAQMPLAEPAPGEDNVTRPKPRKCPKGKRKVKRRGRVVCVKKHRNVKHRKAGPKRRTAR